MNFWVVGKLIGSSLNWNKIRKKQKQKSKNKAVTGNTRFFVNLIHFVLPVIFALTLASDKVVYMEMLRFQSYFFRLSVLQYF